MSNNDGATFDDTAAFFQQRARRAKDDRQRAEMNEIASFYRSLARITPTFPFSYKTPALLNGSANRLAKRAEECKAIAAVIRDVECKAKLLRLAETYDKVAAGAAVAAE